MNWQKVVVALEQQAIGIQHHGREMGQQDSYGRYYDQEDRRARAAACYVAGMMLHSLAEAIKEGMG